MTYACVFLFISLYSCPSRLGILEIFPHYPIPCHFILYKCCTVSQGMNIRNYFNQSPCGRWTLRCFCTQCDSEHPCINPSLRYFDYVCHLRAWQSRFKEALLYQNSLFQPWSVEHLLWVTVLNPRVWCPGQKTKAALPLKVLMLFSYLSHTQCVLCAGCSSECVTFTRSLSWPTIPWGSCNLSPLCRRRMSGSEMPVIFFRIIFYFSISVDIQWQISFNSNIVIRHLHNSHSGHPAKSSAHLTP